MLNACRKSDSGGIPLATSSVACGNRDCDTAASVIVAAVTAIGYLTLYMISLVAALLVQRVTTARDGSNIAYLTDDLFAADSGVDNDVFVSGVIRKRVRSVLTGLRQGISLIFVASNYHVVHRARRTLREALRGRGQTNESN